MRLKAVMLAALTFGVFYLLSGALSSLEIPLDPWGIFTIRPLTGWSPLVLLTGAWLSLLVYSLLARKRED